jgi:hypothetical protein
MRASTRSAGEDEAGCRVVLWDVGLGSVGEETNEMNLIIVGWRT